MEFFSKHSKKADAIGSLNLFKSNLTFWIPWNKFKKANRVCFRCHVGFKVSNMYSCSSVSHFMMKRDAHLMIKFVLISRNERSPTSPERSAGIFLHCDSHLTLHDCRSCPLSFITRNNVTFIPAITIMRFSTCHSRPAAAVRVICWIFLWIQPQRQHEESLHASNLPGKLTSESAIFCLLTLNDCYLQDPWLYSSSSERVCSFCSKTTFWSRWW